MSSQRRHVQKVGESLPQGHLHAPVLQRKCACGQHTVTGASCDSCRMEEQEHGPIQRKAVRAAHKRGVPSIVPEVLRSTGQPLDSDARTLMETRFGHDFSRVRVHTDERAARSAEAVGARAYTVGSEMVFGRGQYQPRSQAGQFLLAHELTHVLQQRAASGLQSSSLQVGPAHDHFEREADSTAAAVVSASGPTPKIDGFAPSLIQRDLARPPVGAPDPAVQLTPAQIAAAIAANQQRFSDPFSIRTIRDVIGLPPVPAVVDEEFVQMVAQWQSEQHLRPQDGIVGHLTTRSIYLELVAEGQHRLAILLIMDSYRLPEDMRLHEIRVGAGANCCGAGNTADAVTFGGPHCPPVGGPVRICFCQARVPTTIAQYDHFIRIAGHELIHVPQCAAGTGNVDVDEFEAFFFEACSRGRAPQLGAADRVTHAQIALGHFARIPVALRTPARINMRNQLNNLVTAGGVGPC